MLLAGIDVGAAVHHIAVVDESEAVVTKPTAFEESAPGYEHQKGELMQIVDHSVEGAPPA